MNFYQALKSSDIITIFKSGFESGKYFLNPEDNKIHNKEEWESKIRGIYYPTDRSWMYVNNPTHYYCDWWHDIATLFHFIPTPCLSCWKVVARPHTVQELMRLNELQHRMAAENPECYCKCGIEERPYIFGNYGGYFYTSSKEQGLERYKQVKEECDNLGICQDAYLNDELKSEGIILKRYCTEFEKAFGPSNQYKHSDEAEHWEHAIAQNVHMEPFNAEMPEQYIKMVWRQWLKFAWDRGDYSIYAYTGGEPMTPSVVTYHNKTNNEV